MCVCMFVESEGVADGGWTMVSLDERGIRRFEISLHFLWSVCEGLEWSGVGMEREREVPLITGPMM